MSLGGSWKIAFLGAGLALGVGGCDLSGLVDKLAADFEAGVKERAAEAQRQAQARIGELGGEVKAYNGAVSVPEGALDGDTMIAIAETPPAAIMAELPGVLEPVTPPMAFTPHGTTFTEPVTLSLFYDEGMPTDDLSVLRLDDEKDTSWERVDDSDVMMNDGVALVSTTHFSVYTVVSCKALPGKLAGVCDDFKNGKISLKDLESLAPPLKDAWAGVDIGEPPADSGEREPGDIQLECDALPDCEAAAKECASDPRSPVCDFVKACQQVFAECGGKGELPVEPPCQELAAACKQGIKDACEVHAKLCGGGTDPGGEPLDRCDKLAMACQARDQNACAAFAKECAVVEPSECDFLAKACSQNDELACAEYGAKCGGDPVDPGPSKCEQLWVACDSGDPMACESFKAICGMPPVEPSPCEQLWLGCDGGDPVACDIFDAKCGMVSEPIECDKLWVACDSGDPVACDSFKAMCGMPPVEPSPCEQLWLGCDGGDPVACDIFDAKCGMVSEPNGCDNLWVACDSGDPMACESFKAMCGMIEPPSP